MPRSWTIHLACVFLVTCLAILTAPAPVRAVTYEFTATSTAPAYWGSFTLQYVDANNDGRFSLDELVPGTFSGLAVHYPIGTLPVPNGFCSTILHVETYDPVNSPFTSPSGTGLTQWVFGWDGGGAPHQWWIDANTPVGAYWLGTGAFRESEAVVVPIPPTALLLGAGLMPLAWARRKKRLGQ